MKERFCGAQKDDGGFMKKLKLDLGKLKVDSFQTSSNEQKRQGTIHGNATVTQVSPTNCDGATCYGDATCYVSCVYPTCPNNICRPSVETCTGPCWCDDF